MRRKLYQEGGGGALPYESDGNDEMDIWSPPQSLLISESCIHIGCKGSRHKHPDATMH